MVETYTMRARLGARGYTHKQRDQAWPASFVFQHLERYVPDDRLKIAAVCPWPKMLSK